MQEIASFPDARTGASPQTIAALHAVTVVPGHVKAGAALTPDSKGYTFLS